MKFIFDNCLPPKYPAALQLLDNKDTYEHVRRKFDESTPDVMWIEALAKEGEWVVISHDKLWRVPQQKEALRRTKLVAFFLNDGWEHLPLMVKMQKLLGIWEKLVMLRPKPSRDSVSKCRAAARLFSNSRFEMRPDDAPRSVPTVP